MALYVVPAVALGIFAACFLVGYAMLKIECPFDRVAFFWTILATDVVAAILAYVLLSPAAFSALVGFTLTKCLIWSIMNHRNIVHYTPSSED